MHGRCTGASPAPMPLLALPEGSRRAHGSDMTRRASALLTADVCRCCRCCGRAGTLQERMTRLESMKMSGLSHAAPRQKEGARSAPSAPGQNSRLDGEKRERARRDNDVLVIALPGDRPLCGRQSAIHTVAHCLRRACVTPPGTLSLRRTDGRRGRGVRLALRPSSIVSGSSVGSMLCLDRPPRMFTRASFGSFGVPGAAALFCSEGGEQVPAGGAAESGAGEGQLWCLLLAPPVLVVGRRAPSLPSRPPHRPLDAGQAELEDRPLGHLV